MLLKEEFQKSLSIYLAPFLQLQAFLKYAIEAQCPLTFPFPGEVVVVMRAGLLRHIHK